MEEVVFKVTMTEEDGEMKAFSVDEYVMIPMGERVLMTVGKSNIEYWDKAGEKVRMSKAIIYLGKKKRELTGA